MHMRSARVCCDCRHGLCWTTERSTKPFALAATSSFRLQLRGTPQFKCLFLSCLTYNPATQALHSLVYICVCKLLQLVTCGLSMMLVCWHVTLSAVLQQLRHLQMKFELSLSFLFHLANQSTSRQDKWMCYWSVAIIAKMRNCAIRKPLDGTLLSISECSLQVLKPTRLKY